MGRLYKNPMGTKEITWVCCICGIPEWKGYTHTTGGSYDLITEKDYRSVQKAMREAGVVSSASRPKRKEN